MKKVILVFSLVIAWPLQASAEHEISSCAVDAGGNTQSGGQQNVFHVLGQTVIGQAWGTIKSIQAGYFNKFSVNQPTSTVTCTPTVTPVITPTITQTPIRDFGGEIISPEWVFAAPNPIRGHEGKIYFNCKSGYYGIAGRNYKNV